MAEKRRLTVILVPHGDLETRTYEFSYRKLKWALGLLAVLLVIFIVMASSWWAMAAQLARLPGLEKEVARLQAEQAKMAELARTLADVEEQYERVRRLLGADFSATGDADWLPPLSTGTEAGDPVPESAGGAVDTWPLTQSGFVTQELTEGTASHPGLDVAVPAGSYVRAAAPGIVSATGTDEVYGRFVLIDHGSGIQTMYGHASTVFISEGQPVERRELIALSGSTGRSTAPHLHFEVRRDGQPENPLDFVERP